MRWFRNFKYPKLFLLLVLTITAYFLFSNPKISSFISNLNSLGYLGTFIAGFFFSFGFSTPFSTGFFITLNPENIYFAAILGGFGALIADLIIFNFIKFSFTNEFQKLKKSQFIKFQNKAITWTFGKKIKTYLLFAFAGILIASPLPDEAAILVLAGLTKIKQ